MIINPALYVKKDETPVFPEPITLGSGDLTYTTYYDSDANKTYANITGFSYTGSFTSVKFPLTIDGYEIKKVSTYALNTGTFGSIVKVVIPYAVTWDYVTDNSRKSDPRIASQIRALSVVNLPNPLDDCFFKFSYIQELKYQNNVLGANGYAFYGAIIACENMYNLIKGLKNLYKSRQGIAGGAYKGNYHFYEMACNKILSMPDLESIEAGADDYSCFTATIHSIYLPKLTSLVRNTFSETSSDINRFVIKDIYLDICDTIEFGTSSSASPFYGLTNLEHIYTTADNYTTLKTLFDNAPYSTYGTDLSSKVTIYDGTEPQY